MIRFVCTKSFIKDTVLCHQMSYGMHIHSSFVIIEAGHEISNNVVCATSKGSDQHVHTRSLIRAFASLLNIL